MLKYVDCFTFYNELDLLEFRLKELDRVTDHVVLVEALHTFSGQPKKLFYEENKDRYKKYQHKIVHVIVKNMPNNGNAWNNEYHQRNSIAEGVRSIDLNLNDIISITDLDEIPDSSTIQNLKINGFKGIASLSMDMYYYNLTTQQIGKWTYPKITTLSKLRNYSPQSIRHMGCKQILKGGWHFSYFGNADFINNKLKSFSHQELNKPQFTDLVNIQKNIETKQDLFGRSEVRFKHVSIEENTYLPVNYQLLIK